MLRKNIGILGLQAGDEGKGARVTYYARKAVERISEPTDKSIVVVRYQGGQNAGHTVWIGEEEYKLHQIPSSPACNPRIPIFFLNII